MSSGRFGVLELVAFFGIPIAFGLQQLWSLRRERLRDEREARPALGPQGEARQGEARQGEASDGRDDAVR